MIRIAITALAAFFLTACQENAPDIHAPSKIIAPQPVFHTSGNPGLLSDWGQIAANGKELVLADRTIIYDLNSALFSDYALKLRTIYLPKGQPATYHETDTFDFPVGTVITKTFYYPRGSADGKVRKPDTDPSLASKTLDIRDYLLLETRVLARREEGWIALPYVWNESQTNAELKRIGDIKRLTLEDEKGETSFAYLVPNSNQCAGCHATNNTTREIEPIGPKARHLNKDFTYAFGVENQLAYWLNNGVLDKFPPNAPRAVNWADSSESVSDRTRAYLDINCAHCHNQVGPADTSGLHLEPSTEMGPELGLCKPPIAAGTGTGGRLFGIVPGEPDQSIFVYRTASTDPAVMMPELGRALAHEEGVALLEAWISEMEGGCG